MKAADVAPIPTVIVGGSGRMGLQLARLMPEYAPLRLTGAIVGAGSAALGRTLAELAAQAGVPAAPVGADLRCSSDLGALLRAGAGLVIDFSQPAAAPASVAACVAARVPLLMCTTGLGAEALRALDEASQSIPVLIAANTSLGVAVLAALVERAAGLLPGFDIEIVETHHAGKRDAPSGTAMALGRAAAAGRGVELQSVAVSGRDGFGSPRTPGQIGFAALRGGDVAGDHEVLFLGSQERLRFCHSVTDRAVFARGALAAGRWLSTQAAGTYRMADVLKI